MPAHQLLADLRAAGLQVLVQGDSLRVSPRHALDRALRARIAGHKAELLAVLSQEATVALANLVTTARSKTSAAADVRQQDLEALLSRLQTAVAIARGAHGDHAVITPAEGLLRALLEEHAAIIEWAKACNGQPWDRATVARHLVNVAWQQGDMAGVLELADALPDA